MNSRTRQQLTRSIVASLLQSDLSRQELFHLLDEMANDPSFMWNVNLIVREALERIYEPGNKEPGFEKNASTIDRLYEEIQRRRISKREILDRLNYLIPRSKKAEISPNMSVREMLRSFIDSAGPQAIEAFLFELQIPSSTSDPYLTGINKNK